MEATDGNLYGTTFSGATVFKITPSGGILTTLHRFEGTDGAAPYAGLVQASDKNFYGTTSMGGTGANGGTVFKITPLGTLTTLYNFCAQTNCADGSAPWADLVQGTDGDFYGTTNSGGGYGFGSVFKITPSGILTTLHSFDGTDGAWPRAALVQTTDGNFYGTTTAGGNLNCNAPHGCGTVFKLSLGLGPFVETVPTSGKVGATVHILGTNLTGATSVSFNGTVATFTTVSATALRTTVPTGATTGIVTVTTPSGTLNSNVAFRVSP